MTWLHCQPHPTLSEGNGNKQAITLTEQKMMMALTPFLPPPITHRYLVLHHPGVLGFAGEYADLQIPIPTTGLLVSVD